jgi:hypothetical protein
MKPGFSTIYWLFEENLFAVLRIAAGECSLSLNALGVASREFPPRRKQGQVDD